MAGFLVRERNVNKFIKVEVECLRMRILGNPR
jgi:hypothetical protein